MILLFPSPKASRDRPLVAIFGTGLIGSAIVESCIRNSRVSVEERPYSWQDESARLRQSRSLLERLRSFLAARPTSTAFIWSAGSAGFGTSDENAAAELDSFRRILDLAESITTACSTHRHAFHFVSSAGGLFEGCRTVDNDSTTAPRRPYGHLKAAQERMLLSSNGHFSKRIYRPSSVYGPIDSRHRLGLIPVLVLNGLRHRVTHIVGRLTTLRDYVAAEDVGEFIAQRVLNPSDTEGSHIEFLVAGRPTTIHHVKKVVEATLRRRIYISLSDEPVNAGDITFAPRALPADWNPRDIETGVRRIYAQWQRDGADTLI